MQKIHTLIHRLHNPDLGILLIRIALGVVFINAGWMKVTNMAMVVEGFGAIGFPAFLAYFVSYIELIAGILLIIGIFVRYAALLLTIIMLVALFKVHFAAGFSLATGGYEYVFVLALAAFSLATFGAGKYSLAGKLRK